VWLAVALQHPPGAGTSSPTQPASNNHPTLLPRLQAYHVIPDIHAYSSDLSDGQELTTMNGEKLTVSTCCCCCPSAGLHNAIACLLWMRACGQCRADLRSCPAPVEQLHDPPAHKRTPTRAH
jgi:hypothetical protein